MVQTSEFLVQSLIYYPVFNICGFLPVIPGPCGLFRSSDVLQESVRSFYFDIVNASPQNTSMVIGNFKIAEDRVLAYASVLKTKDDKKQMFINDGVFYFECETSMNAYLFQRRRWINGTFAAFIYLFFTNPMLFWNSNINHFRKIVIMFFMTLNFLQLVFVIIVPAISFILLKDSLWYVMENMTILFDTIGQTGENYIYYTILLFSWCIYIIHIMVHNNVKWNGLVIKLLFWLSCLMTILPVICIGIITFDTHDSFYHFYVSTNVTLDKIYIDIVFDITIAGLCLPIIIMFINEPKSTIDYIKSIVPFALSFHLIVAMFASYSFVRCWDLSWGNRPAQSELNVKNAQNIQNKISQLKNLSKNVSKEDDNETELADFQSNDKYGDTLDETDENIDPIVDVSQIESERLRKRFKDYSKFIAIGLVLVNLIVFFSPRNAQFVGLGVSVTIGSIFVFVSALVCIAKCIALVGQCIWRVIMRSCNFSK